MSDEKTFGKPEEVASATECTGLMPVLPMDAQQDAEYASLYGIHKSHRNQKMKSVHK